MGNSSSTPTDKYGCPAPAGSRDYNDRGTAWDAMRWTALGCTAATALVSLTLILQHLRRYRAPKEQRQIIRIAFSIPIYATIAFFEIYQYSDARFIDPLSDLYEAFGLCALYLLFVQYAAPSGTFDEETFAAVKAQEESPTPFSWPKITWIFVFQYPITETLAIIVEEATQATGHFCNSSLSPKFAHIWIQILTSFTLGACVISIIGFRGHMKALMKNKRGLTKIVCFKAVVFLRFLQQWVFSILLETKAVKPGKMLSYNDILWGLPATLTCVEMALLSLAFWYAFSASEYSSTAHPEKAMPIWKAIPNALNPSDIIMGMLRVVPLFLEVRRSGDWAAFRVARRNRGLGGKVRKRFGNNGRVNAQRGPHYDELPSGAQSPAKPAGSHHMRNVSGQSHRSAGAQGRLSPSNVYQPPASDSPYDASAHLMADAYSYPNGGQWNGQTYEPYGRSRSPSPGRV